MAIKLRGVRCEAVDFEHYSDSSNEKRMTTSDIICGGYAELVKDSEPVCYYFVSDNSGRGTMLSRCSMSQADSVFMFLMVIVVAVAAVLGYLRMKRDH